MQLKHRFGFSLLLASLITIVTYISIKPTVQQREQQQREQQQQQRVTWPWVCARVFLATLLGAIVLSILVTASGSDVTLLRKGGASSSDDSIALALALSHIDNSPPTF
jgi:hypothetical protein